VRIALRRAIESRTPTAKDCQASFPRGARLTRMRRLLCLLIAGCAITDPPEPNPPTPPPSPTPAPASCFGFRGFSLHPFGVENKAAWKYSISISGDFTPSDVPLHSAMLGRQPVLAPSVSKASHNPPHLRAPLNGFLAERPATGDELCIASLAGERCCTGARVRADTKLD
jgi:hypothetical protein